MFALTEDLVEVEAHSDKSASGLHWVYVNVSPLTYCHSLLIPYFEQLRPQVLTDDALQVALQTARKATHPALRLAFNSLGEFNCSCRRDS